jgi:3-hydroxybutyryl-CoA dehydrogenase
MIRTLGIVGAGTMGSGIAAVAARAGLTVILYDANPDALAHGAESIRAGLGRNPPAAAGTAGDPEAIRSRITYAPAMEQLSPAGAVIEAASEDLAVKTDLFRALDRIVPSPAILATNTSSLSVTTLGRAVAQPDRVVGMHFFNPPARMDLVEIVRGGFTSPATIESAIALAVAMGKTPVVCRDTPGFIVNRVARPFYGEALRLLGEGVAPIEQIDDIVTHSGGFPMGPFALMDLIGIDINFAVTTSVYEQFFQEPRFRPHPIQRRMVEAGTLGRKTGRGFYDYPAGPGKEPDRK